MRAELSVVHQLTGGFVACFQSVNDASWHPPNGSAAVVRTTPGTEEVRACMRAVRSVVPSLATPPGCARFFDQRTARTARLVPRSPVFDRVACARSGAAARRRARCMLVLLFPYYLF